MPVVLLNPEVTAVIQVRLAIMDTINGNRKDICS